MIKDKYNWIALGFAAILFFIAEKFIFISQIGNVSEGYFHTENPITFEPLNVFYSYFANINSVFGNFVLYLFWIGFGIFILNLLLSYGNIRKSSELKADLFNLIAIVVTLGLFIYVLRTPDTFGEPRWYLPLAFSAFIAIGKGSIWLFDRIKPYSRNLALGTIILIIGISGFYQVQMGGDIIDSRINSFSGIRDASLFLKDISSPSDVIITRGMPQVAYYSERNAVNIQDWGSGGVHGESTLEETLEMIRKTPEARFVIITFSEPGYLDWARRINYASNNGQTVIGSWEIPFMDTSINHITGEQNIKQEKIFGDIGFNLLKVEQDVFIYEVIRQ